LSLLFESWRPKKEDENVIDTITPRGKDRGEELTDMDEEAETKAIEKWLRMVDKPLATKEGDKKDAEPRDE